MFTAFLVLPFFFAGIIAFLVCVAARPLRRFALSSALWFVALLPGLFIGLIIGGLWRAAMEHMNAAHMHWEQDLVRLSQTKSATVMFDIAIAMAMIALASIIAMLHQSVIHRLTLALFKLYVASVGFGIGLLLALLLAIGLAVASINVPHPGPFFLTLTILLSSTTAFLCFRNASSLRGKLPRNFPIVTEKEFGTTS